MPHMKARMKKLAIRASETRFEIVIVIRSLEAAKAISAGNSSNLIASASIDDTSLARHHDAFGQASTISALALPNG
jgi:hypothetical protein